MSDIAKKVGRPVKASLSFVRKFSDGSRIEVSTDTATVKVAGYASVTVTVYRFDKANEITNAEEVKFFGETAEAKGTDYFRRFLTLIISDVYKFPSEIEAEEEANRKNEEVTKSIFLISLSLRSDKAFIEPL